MSQLATRWQGRGTAFAGKPRRLDCTLLACWEAGYKDPWLILTDLAPDASEAGWYGMRAWIEQSFKLTKRATTGSGIAPDDDPARLARCGMTLAVATLWLVSIGGESATEQATWSDGRHHAELIQRHATHVVGITPAPVLTLGATDCRFWRARGVPAYVYGCSPVGMGVPNEAVKVEEYLAVLQVHALSAFDYLSRPDLATT